MRGAQGGLTQLDHIADCAHDQKTHSNCLRDFDELSSIGYGGKYQYKFSEYGPELGVFGRKYGVLRKGSIWKLTLCTPIYELCAIPEKLFGNVRQFL
jgi:hypothetical protein